MDTEVGENSRSESFDGPVMGDRVVVIVAIVRLAGTRSRGQGGIVPSVDFVVVDKVEISRLASIGSG
jgi:hypothetical protein